MLTGVADMILRENKPAQFKLKFDGQEGNNSCFFEISVFALSVKFTVILSVALAQHVYGIKFMFDTTVHTEHVLS